MNDFSDRPGELEICSLQGNAACEQFLQELDALAVSILRMAIVIDGDGECRTQVREFVFRGSKRISKSDEFKLRRVADMLKSEVHAALVATLETCGHEGRDLTATIVCELEGRWIGVEELAHRQLLLGLRAGNDGVCLRRRG